MESAEQAGHLHFGPPVSPRTETRICLWGETVYALTANCTLSKVAYQGDGASIPYKFLEARADGETGSVVALSRNGGDWTQWHVDGYDSHYSFVPLEIPGYRQGDKEWHFWVGDSPFVPDQVINRKGNLILKQRPGECVFIPAGMYHMVKTLSGPTLIMGAYVSDSKNTQIFGSRLGILGEVLVGSALRQELLSAADDSPSLRARVCAGATDSEIGKAVYQILSVTAAKEKGGTTRKTAAGRKRKRTTWNTAAGRKRKTHAVIT